MFHLTFSYYGNLLQYTVQYFILGLFFKLCQEHFTNLTSIIVFCKNNKSCTRIRSISCKWLFVYQQITLSSTVVSNVGSQMTPQWNKVIYQFYFYQFICLFTYLFIYFCNFRNLKYCLLNTAICTMYSLIL